MTPPSPVPMVATAYASETSARGHPNSAASGVRNTAMVNSTPNPMAAITVETATMSQARCMRGFYVLAESGKAAHVAGVDARADGHAGAQRGLAVGRAVQADEHGHALDDLDPV